MFSPDSLSWLLLPLGIVLGWVLATRIHAEAGSQPTHDSESTVDVALDAMSDDAITAIGRAADANPALAELQLTLGALFRRRGEVDRAIAVHERLHANTALSNATRDDALYELAQDYLKAGLMDRAEALLHELINRTTHAERGLELLLSTHEQTRDWQQAIDVASQLQGIKARDFSNRLAHYHCELAEQVLDDDPVEARRLARRALYLCPASVRASLLLGAIAEKLQDPIAALNAYRRVPEQDARFLPEVIASLERCSNVIHQPEMFVEFIEEAEQRLPQAGCVVLARARLIGQDQGDVMSYLAARLAQHPHWPGLLAWIDAQSIAKTPAAAGLGALRDALRKRLDSRPGYRCTHCGLTPGMLFWQCPSCKQWDSVVPDEDRL